MRNQRLNAPQVKNQLEPDGSGLGCSAHPLDSVGWGTLRLVDFAGREAMVNACGVAVARLQGHSWAPTPLKGSRVNVGTTSLVPPRRPARAAGGKVRRRLMPTGWGGGSVVVRAQESCAHGEGIQRVRSIVTDREGRW